MAGPMTGPKAPSRRAAAILDDLRSRGSPKNISGMARFGIAPKTKVLGISVWDIRKIAKDIGRSHDLALELWDSGIHEARILASIIDEPTRVSEAQMDRWAKDFDSWDIVDQVCGNLFDKTPYAIDKALQWSTRDQKFVKRAGYSLIAYLAVHDKKLPNSVFVRFLPAIVQGSTDERNFVRKAVNWSLRQIGKRNPPLNKVAIRTAREIQRIDSKAARWVAANALRELKDPRVQSRWSH